MPKGNPNPSPATRFQKGQVANPTGKTAAQAARDAETSELASRFRNSVISKVMEKVDSGDDPLSLLTSDVIRIVKESEDRHLGTPRQSVEHLGEGGGPLVVNLLRFADNKPSE